MIVVNPVGAGGLTLSKLALANAAVADVLSGKKFYSQDKTLKTGTLQPIKCVHGAVKWSEVGPGYYTISLTTNFQITDVFMTCQNNYRQFVSIHWSSRYSNINQCVEGSTSSAEMSSSPGRVITVTGNSLKTASFSLPNGLVDQWVEYEIFGN